MRTTIYKNLILKIIQILKKVYRATIGKTSLEKLFSPIANKVIYKDYLIRSENEDKLEEEYETHLGITTLGNIIIDDTSGNKDATKYEPTRYNQLKVIFSQISLGENEVFVDIGCGKGRVLYYAAQMNFKKIIGIELSKDLSDVAKEVMGKLNKNIPVEINCVDAATFDMSEGTIFYMSNPFGEKTMESVIANIEKSYKNNPRRIQIAYLYPICQSVLNAADWLTPVNEFIILGYYYSKVKIWQTKFH